MPNRIETDRFIVCTYNIINYYIMIKICDNQEKKNISHVQILKYNDMNGIMHTKRVWDTHAHTH